MSEPLKDALSIVPLALLAIGCVMPHIERTHPAVRGVVLENGVPVQGAAVRRCIDGCEEIEQVVTNADGMFDLPEHKALRLLILPIPHDPTSDFGFDLDVNNVAYLGVPRAGIGRPPAWYTVACELAEALPKAQRGTPGLGTATPSCKMIHLKE